MWIVKEDKFISNEKRIRYLIIEYASFLTDLLINCRY